jgi:hypothetical protein
VTRLTTWAFSEFVAYTYLAGSLVLAIHNGDNKVEDLYTESFRAGILFCEFIFIGKYLKLLVIDELNNLVLFSITKEGKLEKVADTRLPSTPVRLFKFEKEAFHKNFYFGCEDGDIYCGLPFYSEDNIFLSLEHRLTEELP